MEEACKSGGAVHQKLCGRLQLVSWQVKGRKKKKRHKQTLEILKGISESHTHCVRNQITPSLFVLTVFAQYKYNLYNLNFLKHEKSHI